MATNGQPTPPPSDQPSAAAIKPEAPKTTAVDPEVPLTSAQNDGTSKRPRDARLIHAVLNNYGISNYQERVPLQLLDFAYRYTSGILSDSLRLAADGYTNAPTTGGRGKANIDEGEKITVTSLRQAIAAKQGYTFQGALPKEFMLQQAMERNRVALPKVERGYGVQLPPEKYCLTGVGWNMKEEWDSEEEADDDDDKPVDAPAMERSASQKQREDETMGGMGDTDEDEEGAGRMEDVFGEEGGGDVTMAQD